MDNYKYTDKLDKEYFKRRIKQRIAEIMQEGGLPEEQLKELEELEIQVNGLRDVFFLFTYENNIDISYDLKKMIQHVVIQQMGSSRLNVVYEGRK